MNEALEAFLQRTVMGDEHAYSSRILQRSNMKAKWKQWPPRGGSSPVKATPQPRAKVTAAVSYDVQGILFVDFLQGHRTMIIYFLRVFWEIMWKG